MNIDDTVVCPEGNSKIDEKILQLLDRTFSTHEELIDSVKNFCLVQGYVTTIRNSCKDRYVTIGCDRGGCYRDRHNLSIGPRQRIMSSCLINCPFDIRGRKQNGGLWMLELKNGSHNHEPSMDMLGHPSCRRLSKDETRSVEEMTMSGIPPRQIVSSLRQNNPNLHANARTVCNMKQKIHKKVLGGRTRIQALFDELGESGFRHNVRYDPNDRLTHLFFAHPCSIILAKSYSHVFVMDCTYKTNKYKMPLLEVIGITSFNTSFYSCFVFLEKEGTEDYVWALNMFSEMLGRDCQPSVIVSDRELALMNAIEVVFPRTINLLCVWHIEKNILSNCKSHFEEGEDFNALLSSWNSVVYSSNEVNFEENWKNFELVFKEKKDVLSYIQRTWLPFKERFVSAWTEKYLHFGTRVSSRAESSHAKLKKYLLVSTGDLRQVKDKICLLLENDFQAIKTQLSCEKIRTPHNCNVRFFKELVTHVSMYAMKELYKQYEMVRHSTMQPLCTGHFMSTMGLPCAHKMVDWKDGVLPLYTVHSQWRLHTRSLTCINGGITEKDEEFKEVNNEIQSKYQQWPLVQKENALETISQLVDSSHSLLLEPNVKPHKGRPLGSRKRKETSSTRRDLSQFEIVDKTRKCGICKCGGHNSRTCPNITKDTVFYSHEIPSSLDSQNITDAIDLNMLPNWMDDFAWD